MMKKLLAALFVLSLGTGLPADEVVLRNGSKLEGTVTENGSQVVIDVGSGTIAIDRSEVRSIHRQDDLNREFDRRMAQVKPDDAEGYYQVYLWTRQNPALKARSERLLRRILEIDPNHEGARRALGYVNYKGAWLTPDEHKAALGLVWYGGQWMSAEAAERLRRFDQQVAETGRKDAEQVQRDRDQFAIELQRNSLRQQVLDMIRAGDLPNLQSGVGLPWGLRYWGPAIGASQPPAQ